MSPTVSVVIATYNYGRYLGGALASALGQTLDDLEVIIVDDGSTDDTASVAASFRGDPRVRYYRVDHLGQPAAKNVGIRLAQAPLIAFLDADDVWLPTKLEQQVKLFADDPDLGVVFARTQLIDSQGRRLEKEQPPLPRGNVLDEMFRQNFVCFSTALTRADVLHRVGLFDETLALAIDYDLWLRVARDYRFDYVDEELVQYRTGHGSLSRRQEERLLTVQRIMDRFLGERGGRVLVDPAVVRWSYAETSFHLGLVRRAHSRLAALPCYLKAISLQPGYGLAWQGLASLPLPETLRRWCRMALGRPADWSVPRVAVAVR